MESIINDSELTGEEKEKILRVVRQQKELERQAEGHVKDLQEELKAIEQGSLSLAEAKQRPNACVRCGENFSSIYLFFVPFNICALCVQQICRNCSFPEELNKFICSYCKTKRIINGISGTWFRSQTSESPLRRESPFSRVKPSSIPLPAPIPKHFPSYRPIGSHPSEPLHKETTTNDASGIITKKSSLLSTITPRETLKQKALTTTKIDEVTELFEKDKDSVEPSDIDEFFSICSQPKDEVIEAGAIASKLVSDLPVEQQEEQIVFEGDKLPSKFSDSVQECEIAIEKTETVITVENYETKTEETPLWNEPLPTIIQASEIQDKSTEKTSRDILLNTEKMRIPSVEKQVSFSPVIIKASDNFSNNGFLRAMIKCEKSNDNWKIKIKVIEATDLRPIGTETTVSSFVLCHVTSQGDTIFKKKTPVVKECSAPIWGDTFEFNYKNDLRSLLIFLLVKKFSGNKSFKGIMKKKGIESNIYGSVRIGAANYLSPEERNIWETLHEHQLESLSKWIEFKVELKRGDSVQTHSQTSIESASKTSYSEEPESLQIDDTLAVEETLSYRSISSQYYGDASVTGNLFMHLKFSRANNILTVTILRAEGLTSPPKSSAFTKVFATCNILPKVGKETSKKTVTDKNIINPTWESTFIFNLDPSSFENSCVVVNVYRQEKILAKNFIGQVVVPIGALIRSNPSELTDGYTDEYSFTQKIPHNSYGFKGTISLSLRFEPISYDGLFGNLEVRILRASHLRFDCKARPLDSYVTCMLLPDLSKDNRKKSKIVKNNSDPEYKCSFSFQNVSIAELKSGRALEVTVWTKNSKFIGGSRFSVDKNYGFNEFWQDSSKMEASLWTAVLEKPKEWAFATIPLRYSMISQLLYRVIKDDVKRIWQDFISKVGMLTFYACYSTTNTNAIKIDMQAVEGVSFDETPLFCKVVLYLDGTVSKTHTQYVEHLEGSRWSKQVVLEPTPPDQSSAVEIRLKTGRPDPTFKARNQLIGRVLLSSGVSGHEWDTPTPEEKQNFKNLMENPNDAQSIRLRLNSYAKPKTISRKSEKLTKEVQKSSSAKLTKRPESSISRSKSLRKNLRETSAGLIKRLGRRKLSQEEATLTFTSQSPPKERLTEKKESDLMSGAADVKSESPLLVSVTCDSSPIEQSLDISEHLKIDSFPEPQITSSIVDEQKVTDIEPKLVVSETTEEPIESWVELSEPHPSSPTNTFTSNTILTHIDIQPEENIEPEKICAQETTTINEQIECQKREDVEFELPVSEILDETPKDNTEKDADIVPSDGREPLDFPILETESTPVVNDLLEESEEADIVKTSETVELSHTQKYRSLEKLESDIQTTEAISVSVSKSSQVDEGREEPKGPVIEISPVELERSELEKKCHNVDDDEIKTEKYVEENIPAGSESPLFSSQNPESIDENIPQVIEEKCSDNREEVEKQPLILVVSEPAKPQEGIELFKIKEEEIIMPTDFQSSEKEEEDQRRTSITSETSKASSNKKLKKISSKFNTLRKKYDTDKSAENLVLTRSRSSVTSLTRSSSRLSFSKPFEEDALSNTLSIFTNVAITGQILIGLKYWSGRNQLTITVKNATDVTLHDPKKDRNDSFVKIHVFPDQTKNSKFKTKVIKSTISPVWNENFSYNINASDLKLRKLIFTIYHRSFAKKTFLGQVIIPMDETLNTIMKRGYIESWYPLSEKAKPEVIQEMVNSATLYFSTHLENIEPSSKAKKQTKKCDYILTVKICDAKNVGTLSPVEKAFCKVYLVSEKAKEEKMSTKAVENTSGNFKWDQSVTFEVTRSRLQEFGVVIKIVNSKKVSHILGSVQLNNNLKTFPWQESKSEESDAWHALLSAVDITVKHNLQLRPGSI